MPKQIPTLTDLKKIILDERIFVGLGSKKRVGGTSATTLQRRAVESRIKDEVDVKMEV